MGELAVAVGVAMATQFLSAAITEPKKETDAYKNAKDICDQIPKVQKQIDDVIDLRTKIATATVLEKDTQQKIIELSTEIKARMNSISEMQGKFKLRILISVIRNIIIVAIMGIFLYS